MASSAFRQIAVVGAGSWGTALAVWLAARGHGVTLWGHDGQHIEDLRRDGGNEAYLPGVPLPPSVRPTADLTDLRGADLALLVTPSRALREVASRLASVDLHEDAVLLSCTKGIEHGSGLRMSEIISECLPHRPVAVLSGPSHAEEVARGGPTAIVLGCAAEQTAKALQRLFNADALRVYTSDDVAGIELGGALKNIFAIAAGMSDGLGFGDNAKAALVTRSLAELIRLGVHLGGRRETFQGLSGIGDLMVTCFSRLSRNRMVGERLGRGETLRAVTASMRMVAEGVPTTLGAFEQSKRVGVETPIIDQIYAILYADRAPLDALQELFTRDPRSELESYCNL